jgi:NitT/TauT family transport system substrate-binding protein
MPSVGTSQRTMKKSVAMIIAVVTAIALMGFGAWYLTNVPTTSFGTSELVTIGVPPNEQSALILIAEDQGFFTENGLNATVKTYDTALSAVEGMKKGEVDTAESAEFPIVREAFKKENVSIITCIDKFQNVYLVSRKDRRLENVSDLKGKKIGVARGTLTEFYLGRFLNLHGVSLQDVTLVNMPFSQSSDALANGSVDAFQVQYKDIPQIKEKLGDNLVLWPSQSDQSGYEVISGRNDWIASHQGTITRLLRSLVQAEEFYISHTNESMAIIQKRLNYTDAYMAPLPSQHQYSLVLDQSMVLAMEDEGRWMINNNLTTEKTIPDYRNYIYAKGLDEVRSESVNIIS